MKHFYILVIAMFLVNSAIAQWIPLNTGVNLSLYSVYFTDANVGYAGGEDGLLIKTIDGGTTWDTLLFNTWPYLYFNSIYFTDANTGYIAGNGMLKTIDAGMNWTYYDALTGSLQSVCFTETNIGYTVGLDDSPNFISYFYKTIDAGATWTHQLTLNGEGIYSLYFTDSNTGYAVGTSILKTTDGGISWDTVFNPHTVLSSVCFTDDNTGYAVGNIYSGEGGIILKTNNGGITWDTLAIGPDNERYLSVYFTDFYTGYAVGYNVISKTTDAGLNWINQSSLGGNSVYFPSQDTGYITGWNGSILKTTNGGGYPASINDKPLSSITLKIYPNPSSDNITFENFVEGTISIQSLNGLELLNQPISRQSAQIDITNLTAGIYFLKLMNEKTVQVGKFIKQ